MSTFTLGQLQVRRSGYGAMQLARPFIFGTVRRCRASRNGMKPRFQWRLAAADLHDQLKPGDIESRPGSAVPVAPSG